MSPRKTQGGAPGSALAGVSAPAEFLFRQSNGFSHQHAALSGGDPAPTLLANDVIDAQSLAELEFCLFGHQLSQ